MKKLIYLEDAINVITKHYCICDDLLDVMAYEDLLEVIAHEIEQLPPAFPCPEGFDPAHLTEQDKKDILEVMEWVKKSLNCATADGTNTNVGTMISRQGAIDAHERIFDRCEEIEAHLPEGDPDRVGYKMYPDWLTVWKYLHQVPSAEPERKTGKWIEDCECSVCHWINEDDGGDTLLTYYNYCQNCGAKMEVQKCD